MMNATRDGRSHPSAHRSALQGRLRAWWGALWVTPAALQAMADEAVYARGLGKGAGLRFLARRKELEDRVARDERDDRAAAEDFLARAEAHAAEAGGRFRDGLYHQAVTGVLQRTRLEQEQQELLMPPGDGG